MQIWSAPPVRVCNRFWRMICCRAIRTKSGLFTKSSRFPCMPGPAKRQLRASAPMNLTPQRLSYRSSIFAHQSEINVTNVRDQLLQLGENAGLNRLKLAACMDSEASLSRVEADLREGNELQVTSTPTCFINGKMVVGIQPPAEFYKVIDAALRHAH